MVPEIVLAPGGRCHIAKGVARGPEPSQHRLAARLRKLAQRRIPSSRDSALDARWDRNHKVQALGEARAAKGDPTEPPKLPMKADFLPRKTEQDGSTETRSFHCYRFQTF